MRRAYIEKRFTPATLGMIEVLNDIIEEYSDEGYDLTLRQLYYQLVAKDLISNTERSYKKVGNVVNDGRLAGYMDWDSIVDRTRASKCVPTLSTPKEGLEDLARRYFQDVWENQETYVEVWVEKEALAQVVSRAANHFCVPWFSCRGYVSQSAMHEAALRFRDENFTGKDCHLIHLGDHDPSGIDMTRDIKDRMELFGANTQVHRIALNMDQVDMYSPPPNPAKITDSRAEGYISRYGNKSWELDALPPSVLEELIRDEIESFMDMDAWRVSMEEERRYKQELNDMADKYN